MRLELTFKVENDGEMPSDYRRIFVAYLKKSIESINQGKYYERYFASATTKPYSFSVILPKPIFRGEVIKLNGWDIKMIFSSEDKDGTGLIFSQAFLRMKNRNFKIPNKNSITLKHIKILSEKEIVNQKVIFKTVAGAGLVIREHSQSNNSDKYYVLGEEKAEKQLKVVLKEQLLKRGFSDEVAEDIQIKPIQCKKVVARHYASFIDSTVGMFEMQADPKILQYFYKAGIGSRSSIGFGLVDLVTQDLL
jgi:CRISPR-associated endoribonuclease Cas6